MSSTSSPRKKRELATDAILAIIDEALEDEDASAQGQGRVQVGEVRKDVPIEGEGGETGTGDQGQPGKAG